jgi:transposase-like protein
MWLRFCLTLSLRDAEEIMAHRGVDVSDETMRAWTVKFGPKSAANLRHRKLPPSPRWRLGEMVVGNARERVFLWRAVDDEGEGLDIFVQKRRDTRAALKLLLCSQPASRVGEHRNARAGIVQPGASGDRQ